MATARPSARRTTPWYTVLTLDMIISAAQKSILHPFIAWMVPLSLRAVTVPYQATSFKLSVMYAAGLSLLSILATINHWVVHGAARRPIDHADQVVVITGGAGGLGLLLASFYRMNGASVAVLDIQPVPAESSTGLNYYECDVADAQAISRVHACIKQDLGQPTILINNAGLVLGKSILSLSPDDLGRSINVNLVAHFHTIRTFLPDMLAAGAGTIVTISSVLGYLGCANSSDYTACKAALVALHASLRAELTASSHLHASQIKTILVAPGQLDTPMFAGLKTPSNFLAPVVEPVQLARQIVSMIDAGESGEIRLPFYTKLVPLLMAFPASIQHLARWLTQMDQAMINFTKDSKKT